MATDVISLRNEHSATGSRSAGDLLPARPSLFLLGGNFRDKVRSLLETARVVFPQTK